MIKLHIFEHDLFPLWKFRYHLVSLLSNYFSISIYVRYSSFDPPSGYLSNFNIFSSSSFFEEFIAMRRSIKSSPDAVLIFGLRTLLAFSVASLFSRRIKSKVFFLLPGIGRTCTFPNFILSPLFSYLSIFPDNFIFLNTHDLSLFNLSGKNTLLLPSEGVDFNQFSSFNSLPAFNNREGLVYIGRLIEYKGIFNFLDLLPSEFTLNIYGFGNSASVSRVQSYRNAIYYGSVISASEYFIKYKYFVFPSFYCEGFPISIIESILCGCIPICCDIPQLSHLKSHVPDLCFLPKNYTCSDFTSLLAFYEDNIDFTNNLRIDLLNYVRNFHNVDLVSNQIKNFLINDKSSINGR